MNRPHFSLLPGCRPLLCPSGAVVSSVVYPGTAQPVSRHRPVRIAQQGRAGASVVRAAAVSDAFLVGLGRRLCCAPLVAGVVRDAWLMGFDGKAHQAPRALDAWAAAGARDRALVARGGAAWTVGLEDGGPSLMDDAIDAAYKAESAGLDVSTSLSPLAVAFAAKLVWGDAAWDVLKLGDSLTCFALVWELGSPYASDEPHETWLEVDAYARRTDPLYAEMSGLGLVLRDGGQ